MEPEWSLDNSISIKKESRDPALKGIGSISPLRGVPEEVFDAHFIKPSLYQQSIRVLVDKLNNGEIPAESNFEFVIGYSEKTRKYYILGRAPARAEDIYEEILERAKTRLDLESSEVQSRSQQVEPFVFTGIFSPTFEESHNLPLLPLPTYGVRKTLLGKGTYGSVYVYSSPQNSAGSPSKSYAVKSMVSNTEGTIVDFSILREISALVRLNHPNIIPIVDVDITRSNGVDLVNVVMPLATLDLYNYLNHKPQTVLLGKFLTYQILRGVNYCLQRDVLNRDIKPQNILMFSDSSVKIADFGLATPFGCTNTTGFTKGLYSLWYRPPEVLLYGRYGPAADIWAVGCVFYEVFSGKPLFPSNDEKESMLKRLRLLGSINPKEWPQVVNYPKWSEYADYKYEPLVETLLPSLNNRQDVLDILLMMVQLNPIKRKSLNEVLAQPFFDEVRSEVDDMFPFKEDRKILTASGVPSCIDKLALRERYPSRPKLTVEQRRAMVGWLTSATVSSNLSHRTFFLCCYIVDSTHDIVRPNGDTETNSFLVACLKVACYGDSHIPKFPKTSDSKRMEINVLRALKYDVIIATCFDFLMALTEHTYLDRVKDTAIIMLYSLVECEDAVFNYLPNVLAKAALMASCAYHNDKCLHASFITPEVISVYKIFLECDEMFGKELKERNIRV